MRIEDWPTIVVLDHPQAGMARAPLAANVFWITLDDWIDLHRAIRSTTGLLSYVQRVLATDPTPRWTLGTEGRRYAAFVKADRTYAAEGGQYSVPYLGYEVLDDPVGVALYRDVLEHVWPKDGASVPIEAYRRLIEHLDGLPPNLAAEMGRWIQGKRDHLRLHRSGASGAFLTGDRLTIYACDHIDNYDDPEDFVARLTALMAVRGMEVIEQGRDVKTAAIGVLQGESWLDYQFAYADPPLTPPPDVRFDIEDRFGVFDLKRGLVRPLKVERNERCPCGSGQKYKCCHG